MKDHKCQLVTLYTCYPPTFMCYHSADRASSQDDQSHPLVQRPKCLKTHNDSVSGEILKDVHQVINNLQAVNDLLKRSMRPEHVCRIRFTVRKTSQSTRQSNMHTHLRELALFKACLECLCIE